MIVHLTKEEAEYLSEKPFLDLTRVELDLMFENAWIGNNKKELERAHKFHVKRKKFYRDLYKKLGGTIKREENDGKEEIL